MKIISRTIFALIHLSSLVLLGCTNNPSKGELSKQWSSQLRQYNIVAVFPPREDVQVGDIYLTCGGNETELLPTKVATAPGMKEALQNYYEERVTLPDGSLSSKADILSLPNGAPFEKTTDAITRARNVSFPEFFTLSVSGVDAGAVIPLPSVLAGIGLSSENIASTTLSISAAESYGLPMGIVMQKISTLDKEQLRYMAIQQRNMESRCLGHGIPQLTAVLEVYAARAIDIRMNLTEKAAYSAKTALDVSSQREAIFDKLAKLLFTQYPGSSGDTMAAQLPHDTPPSVSIDLATRDELLLAFKKNLNDMMAAAQENTQITYPGVQANIYFGKSKEVNLTRSFITPVIIGYRGVAFTIDLKSQQQTSRSSSSFLEKDLEQKARIVKRHLKTNTHNLFLAENTDETPNETGHEKKPLNKDESPIITPTVPIVNPLGPPIGDPSLSRRPDVLRGDDEPNNSIQKELEKSLKRTH